MVETAGIALEVVRHGGIRHKSDWTFSGGRMPTLDWIGKQAVVNHHREVPYRLLHCDGELSAGDPEAGNLLVQGDNLEALRALLPYYAGKVKCIYIDPLSMAEQKGTTSAV